ncbi:hypothetical protein GCM10011341_21960 [Frigidibacter albus]|nr:hypothetical protein GCM10011341_21960 [Frigidibacter albus]
MRTAPAEGGAGAVRALWGPVRCKLKSHRVAKAMAFAIPSAASHRPYANRPSAHRAASATASSASPVSPAATGLRPTSPELPIA